MKLNPSPFKQNWGFYLKWVSLGIIAASVITLARYYK